MIVPLWTPRHARARRRLARLRRREKLRCGAVVIVSMIVGAWAGAAFLSELVGAW